MRKEYNQIEDNKWVISLMIFTVVLSFVFLIIKIFCSNMVSCCFFAEEEKVSDIVMVLLTAITILVTVNEYNKHRDREIAKTLGFYNERYSSDKHIETVVNYIIAVIDNSFIWRVPAIHDVELFMRFFEEMEIQIDKGRLYEQQIYDLFAYYALILDSNSEIRSSLKILDYDENEWHLFRSFVQRMIKTKFRNTKWKSNGQEGERIQFNASGQISFNSRHFYDYSYKSGEIIIVESGEILNHVIKGDGNPDELHYKGIIFIEEGES